MQTRAKELNDKYIKSALKHKNELITEYKIGGRNFKEQTILCTVRSILNKTGPIIKQDQSKNTQNKF